MFILLDTFSTIIHFLQGHPQTKYLILYTIFRYKRLTSFLENPVEHQKVNPTIPELPFG